MGIMTTRNIRLNFRCPTISRLHITLKLNGPVVSEKTFENNDRSRMDDGAKTSYPITIKKNQNPLWVTIVQMTGTLQAI